MLSAKVAANLSRPQCVNQSKILFILQQLIIYWSVVIADRLAKNNF